MEKYIINENRLRIKACCASCEHKSYDRGGMRICRLGNGSITKPDFYCTDYSMPRKVMKCGASTGRVKKPSYIAFLSSVRDKEASLNLPVIMRMTVEQIRDAYRAKYGYDIYL
jgi:hypothetical protein